MIEDRPPVHMTDVVLRDAHQSLFATRLRLEDMLPICPRLDRVGFWSLESWGGATFDACIRYLGEDPWHRIRALKEALPNTRQQMLLRAQNLLGYRHYADDVVRTFCERAAHSGVDVFRIFDAMNDVRNMETAIQAVRETGKHAQGTLSYTVSPVHTLETWLTLARRLEDMGADSLCIKDMAGLLKPYDAWEMITRLKQQSALPIHLHCHATTGFSVPTLVKAIEAGIDNVDTAISSMSMTYGHSPTETINAIFHDRPGDPGLDLDLLAEIAEYFREVRKKYAQFEGSLKGVDARIMLAQVPGGMLTNMENQLRDQQAEDRMEEVLKEIPRVREDLGNIALVTPTSQIVGTQAVINVLSGERYQSITHETAGVLKGEYGATASPVNSELQARVLDGEEPITCRPADLLEPEMDRLSAELREHAEQEGIRLEKGDREIDDVLTYALFPQVGLKFLKHRGDPAAFEPPPGAPDDSGKVTGASEQAVTSAGKGGGNGVYNVTVGDETFVVEVSEAGEAVRVASEKTDKPREGGKAGEGEKTRTAGSEQTGLTAKAPLTGTITRVLVGEGDTVATGDVLLILEAMKMETEVKSTGDGTVQSLRVKAGDSVSVGDDLLSIG